MQLPHVPPEYDNWRGRGKQLIRSAIPPLTRPVAPRDLAPAKKPGQSRDQVRPGKDDWRVPVIALVVAGAGLGRGYLPMCTSVRHLAVRHGPPVAAEGLRQMTCILHVAWDERLTDYHFGPGHPLAPVRVELTMRLAHEFGLWSQPGVTVAAAAPATDADLELVHDEPYVQAVEAVSRWAEHPDAYAGLEGTQLRVALPHHACGQPCTHRPAPPTRPARYVLRLAGRCTSSLARPRREPKAASPPGLPRTSTHPVPRGCGASGEAERYGRVIWDTCWTTDALGPLRRHLLRLPVRARGRTHPALPRRAHQHSGQRSPAARTFTPFSTWLCSQSTWQLSPSYSQIRLPEITTSRLKTDR